MPHDRVDNKLVPNEVEQRMIEKVLTLRHNKGYSYGEIVKFLQRNSYTNKSNQEITRNSVVGIIKNLDQNHTFPSIN